jgi:hypothetical protein
MPDAARLLLPRLLAGGWRDLPFVPFRAGIEIHRIYGDGIAGPAAARPALPARRRRAVARA